MFKSLLADAIVLGAIKSCLEEVDEDDSSSSSSGGSNNNKGIL